MMNKNPQWATQGGDAWAARWEQTDRALSGLSPSLLSAMLAAAPSDGLRGLDVGCGPGSTTLDLVAARPDATLVACDVSPSLAEVARQRLEGFPQVDVVLGDAQAVAVERGPFDLLYSRHGVMFFPDPVAAFAGLRRATCKGGAIVFSCFRSFDANSWASALASAAAGRRLPPPGREPSGFAFAEPAYVEQIFAESGWTAARAQAVDFPYFAGGGDGAVEEALSFLSAIGPAARTVEELPASEKEAGVMRMREVIESHFHEGKVEFDAAVWIWTARAGD